MLATLEDIRRVRRELRAMQYDIAVDMQGAVRSAMVARWARDAQRHRRSEPARICGEVVLRQKGHNARRSRDRAIAGDGECDLCGEPADDVAAVAARSGDGVEGSGVATAVCPAQSWCGVGREAVACGPLRRSRTTDRGSRLWSGDQQRSGGRASGARDRRAAAAARRVCFHWTMAELIAVTRRASLAIAGDTGPLHLACALGNTRGGYLWADGSGAQWAVSLPESGAAASGERARSCPAQRAGGGAADHHAGSRDERGARAVAGGAISGDELESRRAADSRAAGICVRSALPVAGAANVAISGPEPGFGCARLVVARICIRLRQKEYGTDRHGSLCAHTQSAVSGLDSDCLWICAGRAQLLDRDGWSSCCSRRSTFP